MVKTNLLFIFPFLRLCGDSFVEAWEVGLRTRNITLTEKFKYISTLIRSYSVCCHPCQLPVALMYMYMFPNGKKTSSLYIILYYIEKFWKNDTLQTVRILWSLSICLKHIIINVIEFVCVCVCKCACTEAHIHPKNVFLALLECMVILRQIVKQMKKREKKTLWPKPWDLVNAHSSSWDLLCPESPHSL